MIQVMGTVSFIPGHFALCRSKDSAEIFVARTMRLGLPIACEVWLRSLWARNRGRIDVLEATGVRWSQQVQS